MRHWGTPLRGTTLRGMTQDILIIDPGLVAYTALCGVPCMTKVLCARIRQSYRSFKLLLTKVVAA